MLSTKILHPTANCQTIAEINHDLQLEVVQVEGEIQVVGEQIDELSRQILSTTSESERRQISEDQTMHRGVSNAWMRNSID